MISSEKDQDSSQKSYKKSADHALKELRENYMFIQKTHIRAWKAWLVIGLVAGIASGVILVANRSGEIGPTQAISIPRLTLSPSATVLGLNGKGQFSAAYDPDGSGPALQQYPLLEEITWTSSNPLRVSVDVHGVLTARFQGTAVITATYNGLLAQAQVKVAGEVKEYSFSTPDGRTRSYLLYIPSQYAAASPTSLILAFHGGAGSGQSMMDVSLMNILADQEGFLVAYPNGTAILPKVKTWNVGPCCGYAQENKVDDVKFVSMLIDHIAERVSIDKKKVYATGLSNGAMMSHRLACQLADKVAAVAPIGGGLNLGGDFTSCAPSRKVSVLNFHGTTDDNYLYYCDVPEGCRGPDAGSQNDLRVSIPSVVHDWVVRNGIPESSKQITYQNGIETCEMHSSPTKDVEVGLCTAKPTQPVKVGSIVYDGGGHAMPGGIRNPGSADADVPTQDISANAAMWDFFKAHPIGTDIESLKRIFLSSQTYTGNLGGLTGADGKCQALANAIPSLAGKTFKAWLSDSHTSAKARLSHSIGPYQVIRHPVAGGDPTIATGWTDLVDGTLMFSISVSENLFSTAGGVWTNTEYNGEKLRTQPELTCNDWTSADPNKSGIIGHSGSIDNRWSNLETAPCSRTSYSLYCVEQ